MTTHVAPATALSRSVVADSAGGSGIPGRYSGFSWPFDIASARSSRRAQSSVGTPFSAVIVANAVPQEPEPITATRGSVTAPSRPFLRVRGPHLEHHPAQLVHDQLGHLAKGHD